MAQNLAVPFHKETLSYIRRVAWHRILQWVPFHTETLGYIRMVAWHIILQCLSTRKVTAISHGFPQGKGLTFPMGFALIGTVIQFPIPNNSWLTSTSPHLYKSVLPSELSSFFSRAKDLPGACWKKKHIYIIYNNIYIFMVLWQITSSYLKRKWRIPLSVSQWITLHPTTQSSY